jgi:SAM-dependent methyltransferase
MRLFIKLQARFKKEQLEVKKKYFPDAVLHKKLNEITDRKRLDGFFSLKEKLDTLEDVYNIFFKHMPSRLIYPLDKYHLGEKKVIDVGCNFGQALIHFGKDSVGLEVDETVISIAKAIGIKNIVQCNVEGEDLPFADNSFDAAYSSNLFEHILAPHLLLRKIFNRLKEGGVLFVGVPLIPSFRLFELATSLFFGLGYKSKWHINAFTRRTLSFMIQRAGFKVVECGVFPFQRGYMNRFVGGVLSDFVAQAMCIAKKDSTLRKPTTFVPESIWVGDTFNQTQKG